MTDVDYAESTGVATITINRPQRHNALRQQTIEELIAAFDRADAAPGVRVVVIAGAGSAAFSAGGDVAMEDAFDPAEGRRMARLLIRLAEAVRGTGKPVIAKIRGWCVGGGNELCLLCDFAIAASSARFAHTDSRLGNSPIWYGTQLLPRLVGARRAREILILGAQRRRCG
ncbi:MAG: enoyl-CoA hydratase/isomerase family protein [Streptosporangiaceae bacterium]|jgi:enoyl-CoA hydratase/carnithine racemase